MVGIISVAVQTLSTSTKINENSQISDYLILTLLFFFRGKENSQKLSIQESLAGIMKLLFTVL